MDLVVDEVVELQDVHVSDRDRPGVGLTGTAIKETGLTGRVHETLAIPRHQGVIEQTSNFFLAGTIEHRGCDLGSRHCFLRHGNQTLSPGRITGNLPTLLGSPTQVDFQDLTEVHTSGNTQGVQDDVNRSSILQERHVLHGENLGDNTLVSVATSELVTLRNLALLSDVDNHTLVDTGAEFIVTIDSVKYLDADDGSLLAVWDLQRGVANLARLLVEDRTEQTLFSAELCFTLRGNFSDQDVAGAHLSTNTDDAALVQVGQQLGTNVRQIAGDLLFTKLGVAGVHLILLDVNRGESVVLHQVLRQDNRVFEVVTLP